MVETAATTIGVFDDADTMARPAAGGNPSH
jgi:hypothetical protein